MRIGAGKIGAGKLKPSVSLSYFTFLSEQEKDLTFELLQDLNLMYFGVKGYRAFFSQGGVFSPCVFSCFDTNDMLEQRIIIN